MCRPTWFDLEIKGGVCGFSGVRAADCKAFNFDVINKVLTEVFHFLLYTVQQHFTRCLWETVVKN